MAFWGRMIFCPCRYPWRGGRFGASEIIPDIFKNYGQVIFARSFPFPKIQLEGFALRVAFRLLGYRVNRKNITVKGA